MQIGTATSLRSSVFISSSLIRGTLYFKHRLGGIRKAIHHRLSNVILVMVLMGIIKIMSLIYAITNKVNGKKYIGKTNHSIGKRFSEHLRDSRRFRCKDRPLYRAMSKYGEENFEISLIEEVEHSSSCYREMFWIEQFGTYKGGYNATKGADGKSYLDYEAIVKTYLYVLNSVRTAEIHCCHYDSVRNILKLYGIDGNKLAGAEIQRVRVRGIREGQEIAFESFKAAATYLLQINGKDKTHTYKHYASHISECCKGKRKTCSGFTWQYS